VLLPDSEPVPVEVPVEVPEELRPLSLVVLLPVSVPVRVEVPFVVVERPESVPRTLVLLRSVPPLVVVVVVRVEVPLSRTVVVPRPPFVVSLRPFTVVPEVPRVDSPVLLFKSVRVTVFLPLSFL
jgi:hypothetical protein